MPAGTFFQAGQGLVALASQDNTSFSLFGQVDFDVTDRLTATLGVNYIEDEKEVSFGPSTSTDTFAAVDFVDVGNDLIAQQAFAQGFLDATGLEATPANIAFIAANAPPGTIDAIQAGAQAFADANDEDPAVNPLLAFRPLQFFPPFLDFPNAVEDGRSEDDNVSYTARLAYDATDSVNVYASCATGFKATSWNLGWDSRPFAADLAALDEAGLGLPNLVRGTRFAGLEESEVYEIGVKTRFPRGALNVTVFDQAI